MRMYRRCDGGNGPGQKDHGGSTSPKHVCGYPMGVFSLGRLIFGFIFGMEPLQNSICIWDSVSSSAYGVEDSLMI
jgi:hypothetical protein